MKYVLKNFLIFCVVFTIYMCIEGIWKTFVSPGGVQSFTMGFLGGFAILFIGQLNRWFTFEMPLVLQAFIGGVFITLCEFVSGLILNVWLGLGIWDYSSMPLNVMGQICIPFTLAWMALAIVAILVDDYLRYVVYGEEKPHYHIFKWGSKNNSCESIVSL